MTRYVSALSVSFQTAANPTTYSYDTENRLYQVAFPDGTTTRYAYDKVGNSVTSTTGGTTVTSVFDANNELTSTSSGVTYAHDVNGDRISRTAGSITRFAGRSSSRDMCFVQLALPRTRGLAVG